MEGLKNKEFTVELELTELVRFEHSSRFQKIYRSFRNIFCGFEDSNTLMDDDKQKEIESQRRIESFQSLNQSKFERYILNTNLVVILVVAVALYVFFSIPPEFHIFSHVKLNRTYVP